MSAEKLSKELNELLDGVMALIVVFAWMTSIVAVFAGKYAIEMGSCWREL